MKSPFLAGCMILALVTFPQFLWGGKPTDLLATDESSSQSPKTFNLKELDAYVAAQVLEKGYVGLSLAIFKDGTIVLAKGYGKTSLEGAAPVQVDTPFAIGSITKQFVCACCWRRMASYPFMTRLPSTIRD
jgi:CubicO group peptidase (beta-lactamase class C family)